MGFWSAASKLISGGVASSLESVALEFIETGTEKAEARALMVKVLDPNGKMRRDISRFANRAYGCYLLVSGVLTLAHAFGFTDPTQSKEAIDAIKELCVPITTAWGVIVGASFGVNAANVMKNG